MTARRDKDKKPHNPGTTVEGRENKVISLALDVAEQQLRDGTASAQVISHFLKLGSTREQLEQDKLARENELLRARVDQLASNKHIEELYEDAIKAMRTYAGQEEVNFEDDYDD